MLGKDSTLVPCRGGGTAELARRCARFLAFSYDFALVLRWRTSCKLSNSCAMGYEKTHAGKKDLEQIRNFTSSERVSPLILLRFVSVVRGNPRRQCPAYRKCRCRVLQLRSGTTTPTQQDRHASLTLINPSSLSFQAPCLHKTPALIRPARIASQN